MLRRHPTIVANLGLQRASSSSSALITSSLLFSSIKRMSSSSSSSASTSRKLFSSKAFAYRVFYQNNNRPSTDFENSSASSSIDYEEKIMNSFETLGICPTTNLNAIKQAYRMKALTVHPDSNNNNNNKKATTSIAKEEDSFPSSSSSLSFQQLQDVYQTCSTWARESSNGSSNSSHFDTSDSSSTDHLFTTLRTKTKIMTAVRERDYESRCKLLLHHLSLLPGIFSSYFCVFSTKNENGDSNISTEQQQTTGKINNSISLVNTSSNEKKEQSEQQQQFFTLLSEHLCDSPISEIEALSTIIQLYLDCHQNPARFHRDLLEYYGFDFEDVQQKVLKISFDNNLLFEQSQQSNNNSLNSRTFNDDDDDHEYCQNFHKLSHNEKLIISSLSFEALYEHFLTFTEFINDGSALQIEKFFTERVQRSFTEICDRRLKKLKKQHDRDTERTADRVLDLFAREILKQEATNTTNKKSKLLLRILSSSSSSSKRNSSKTKASSLLSNNKTTKKPISPSTSFSRLVPPHDTHLELTDRLRSKLSTILDLITPKSLIWDEMMSAHEKNMTQISLLPGEAHHEKNGVAAVSEKEEFGDNNTSVLMTQKREPSTTTKSHKSSFSSKTILGSQVAREIRFRGYHKLATVVDDFCIEAYDTCLARNDYHMDSLVRDLIDASASSSLSASSSSSSSLVSSTHHKRNGMEITEESSTSGTKETSRRRYPVGGDGGSSSTPLQRQNATEEEKDQHLDNDHNKTRSTPQELIERVLLGLDESTTSEVMNRLPSDLKSYRQIHRIG